MFNIKNFVNEFLTDDKIIAWYKINNNVKIEEKFSYLNIRETFINSVKNRFQYKIEEICEDQMLVNRIIQTIDAIKRKESDIIVNGIISNNNIYGICDLLVKGKLLKKQNADLNFENEMYYPCFICTFFNKENNKHINLNLYKLFGKEMVRLLNKIQNNKIDYYVICSKYFRWKGNENLDFHKIEYYDDLKFKNWMDNIFELSYTDLLNCQKIKPYYKYNIIEFEKELLIKRKDVRLLCGIGPKTTNILYDMNIYSWDNPIFLPTIHKLLSLNKYNFIKNILEFNKSGKEIQHLNTFNSELYKNDEIKFFVDYETFGKKKMQGSIEMLYLIGLYVVIKGKCERFHYFMAEKKNLMEEKNIIEQWINCMLKYKKIYNCEKKIKIYHWGHMERSYFNKVLIRQNNYKKEIFFNNFEFIDLCKILSVNQFIFKDFINSYSIKNISNILYKNGKIPISYNDIECKNGFESFQLGIDYYNGLLENRKKIISYNEIDCKTIYYILKYILNTLSI